MSPHRLRLRVLGGEVAVWRSEPGRLRAVDLAGMSGAVVSVTRTEDELSGVCALESVPEGASHVEPGWVAIRVDEPHDLAVTGVLASVAGPLAEAGISIFAVSTYDTDHVLVSAAALERAVDALAAAGHDVVSR